MVNKFKSPGPPLYPPPPPQKKKKKKKKKYTHTHKHTHTQTHTHTSPIFVLQLNELNYAPEIAAAMLRVQQAKAMVAAREHIVQGAVGIAQHAVNTLEQGGLTMTDTEKVKLVTNLLTVTCGDREAVPAVPM